MSYVRNFALSAVALSFCFAWLTTSHARTSTFSRSLGAPNQGRLEYGVRLKPGPSVRILGSYADGNAQWGTRELVELIQRASRFVKQQHKDAVLGVGHLSKKTGGPLERHNSHTSGRDADLALYLTDTQKKPVFLERFATIDTHGLAQFDSRIRFDEPKNWALVSALVQDPHVRVTHIFIAHHLRARLLAYATRMGASSQLRNYASQIMMQPRHALPHDDHMHIRIACPNRQSMCIEYPLMARRASKSKSYMYAKAKMMQKASAKKSKLIRTALQLEQKSEVAPKAEPSQEAESNAATKDINL